MALRGLAIMLAYVTGAIPVGVLVARVAAGVDIRRHGSGNIGATNVLRTLGPVPAVATLLGDVAKGYAAVTLARLVANDPTWTAAGAVLAIVGNCWSVFLRGGGGKGVATGLGAFLALVPWAVGPVALVWAAVTGATRYVSLGSMVACACLPLAAAAVGYPAASVAAAAAGCALVILRHHDNIRRLRAGTERRLGQRKGTA